MLVLRPQSAFRVVELEDNGAGLGVVPDQLAEAGARELGSTIVRRPLFDFISQQGTVSSVTASCGVHVHPRPSNFNAPSCLFNLMRGSGYCILGFHCTWN